jgi:hypothetical protein
MRREGVWWEFPGPKLCFWLGSDRNYCGNAPCRLFDFLEKRVLLYVRHP